MTPETEYLFAMPSPFLSDTGIVRLLEPRDTCSKELGSRLIEGRYDKPFVLEHDGLRSLHFSLHYVQSTMRIDSPEALDLAYTRKMMAFLLFNCRPRKLLLLGLGGGSLAKFCYRHLPAAQITVLEVDPHVIAFRKAFRVPADDDRFTIVHADGARYIAEQAGRTDVLLVDAFDQDGVAPSLAHSSFYENASRCLSANGILVMNIAGDKSGYGPHLEHISDVFGDRVIAMSVKDDGNFVVLAFKNPQFTPRWTWLKSIAVERQKRFGLDFPRYAQLLESGHKRQLVWRLAT